LTAHVHISLVCGVWLATQFSLAHAQDREPGKELQLRAPVTGTAAADQVEPAAALDHYARGRALYLEGRYVDALAELELALRYDPESPELHYNVARLHELRGDLDSAITAYARYRERIPAADAAERARTDATLKRLQGAREEVQRLPVPSAPPQIRSAPAVPRRGVADAAFWTVGSLGLGSLLGAGASGAYALWLDRKHADFVVGKDGNLAAYEAEGRRLSRSALAADVLTITGATLGVSSLLLYALRVRPEGTRVMVDVGPHSAVLTLRGQL
jgi:tetratricopeptide (TPR) repeat protein